MVVNMAFTKPAVGSRIRVRIRDAQWYARIPINTYEGTVVPSAKFDATNTFSMTTGYPAYRKFPVRTLELDRVVEIIYEDGTAADQAPVAEQPKEQVFVVKSSKPGKDYTVIYQNNSWTCDCPGFQFRRACRHIQDSQAAMMKEKN